MNRNLWGVENFEGISIRHSKFAANRFAAQAAPALTQFADSSPGDFIQGIRAARERIVARKDEDRESFLRGQGFSKADTGRIIASVLAEEGMLLFPENWKAVKADLSLIPGLVDEAFRWTAPVKHFMRNATQDTRLLGQAIRASDRLMICYPSGCRDEKIFVDPDRFDITRSPNPHIAFAFGPQCVSANIWPNLKCVFFLRSCFHASGR